MVEVGKAKERMHFLDFGEGWPDSNAIKFDQVHNELIRFHNHSKIFDLRDIELAFLKL